ncbi:hypothetical protein [Glutamicibacter sp. TV12E]|uniref:hypothetical protein n=1 Tax=Glutamicibacter sp. TV12E TaxID=3446362 RepID=UPI0040334F41
MGMTIQEILEAHETYNAYITEGYGVGVDCKCGANVRRAGIKVVESHRAHVAEVLEKQMRDREAEAWELGAATAWQRSSPKVNGSNYHWRHEGEPITPYRNDASNE